MRKSGQLSEKVYLSLYMYSSLSMNFGSIDMGKIYNPVKYPVQWVNIASKGKLILALYKIRLSHFDSNGNVTSKKYIMQNCEKGCHLSFDTTSHFTYGPVLQTNELISFFEKFDLCGNTSDLPFITFELLNVDSSVKEADRIVEFTLMPEEYISITTNQNGERKCAVGVKNHSTNFGWSLGRMFLKPFLFVYDFEDEKIGK